MATETPNWGYRAQSADNLVSVTLEALPEGEERYHIVHVQMPHRSAVRMAQQLLEAALEAEAYERHQRDRAKEERG